MKSVLHSLPAVNALLNLISATLIVIGLVKVRRKRFKEHRQYMIAATAVSVVFLILYLIKTWYLGTTYFGGTGLSRVLYLTILFSHLSLAILLVPMITITLVQGLQRRFDKHRRIARWTYPIWLYVSLTGVTIYLILRPWY